ncbi:unnamed protein product [Paramecium pentaurelia]|uniref:Uncharacterized protein n=1 Tax=Paramecium pentaurelia TaxID=43138 RepID=A0A8S1TP37_9CILI|nr:unnamed protein product [Paramecium pentaurelia]
MLHQNDHFTEFNGFGEQQHQKFREKCQQCLDQCQMNPYRSNYCKLTLNKSLEQIHHIDNLKIFQQNDETYYLQKMNQKYIIFCLNLRYFNSDPKYKQKAAIFKIMLQLWMQCVILISIDKCIVQIYTSGRNSIFTIRIKTIFHSSLYGLIKIKNKTNDDLLYLAIDVLQVFDFLK